MDGITISRRALLAGAVGVAGAAALRRTGVAQTPAPADPTKVPGRLLSALGGRAPFERPRRVVQGAYQGISLTPLQDLYGIVTPSDLHYERHHAGVPAVDPHRYKLLIHGMVERPTVFDLERCDAFRRSRGSRSSSVPATGLRRTATSSRISRRSSSTDSRARANGPGSPSPRCSAR